MIAVYSVTRDRLDLSRKSFKALREWAGIDIDLYVADNGSRDDMRKYLKGEKAKGNIRYLQLNNENLGQNIAANDLIDQIMSKNYDWILRWDSDGIPRTRRFLKKLVKVGERFAAAGVVTVLSPQITKLKHPPEATAYVEYDDKHELEVVEILGGICRLHPRPVFNDFRFSRFAPLGLGEADEMGRFCKNSGVQMIRAPWLEVEHAHGEDGQKELNPEEFTWERREVGRYVSYGL